MTDAAQPEEEGQPRGRGRGLIVAALGALVAGGGGFLAAYGGYLESLLPSGESAESREPTPSFVAIAPLTISLGPEAQSRILRFAAELEVEKGQAKQVEAMMPRIVDVLNTYLRAVDEAELDDPAALALLRAQMLRRIQIVVGDGLVRDLLILEFILS